MLNSLQFLNSFIVIILISNSLVSAEGFGVSPSEVVLDMTIYQEKCIQYKIYGELGEFYVEDLWSNKDNPRGVEDYNLKISEVDVIYPNIFSGSKINVCFTTNEEGNYKGLILFDKVGSNIAIGSKIVINSDLVRGDRKQITGLLILNEYGESFHFVLFFELGLILVLLLVIFILVRKRNYHR